MGSSHIVSKANRENWARRGLDVRHLELKNSKPPHHNGKMRLHKQVMEMSSPPAIPSKHHHMYTLSDDETDTATHYSDKGVDGYNQPLVVDRNIGPGEYQVRDSIIQKYVKGSPWGASKEERKSKFDMVQNDDPVGPGSYDETAPK